MLKKRGQITIFVILAIVIVVGGISYFVFRDTITAESIPVSIEPVKVAIIDCIESKTTLGVSLLEVSGGYINNLPKFEAGSKYQPFSSELTFVGVDIPYWFYMSGSNLARSQVPTIESMEIELENFLDEEIASCYLDNFLDEGYDIEIDIPKSSVAIKEDYIDLNVDMEVVVSKELDVAVINNYELRVDTNLGYLYNEAKSIYDEEQSSFFLENYTIDVLNLYAPVDGVEISCSPKTWQAKEIYSDVREALQANTMQLRNDESNEEYFNINLKTDAKVNFLYFKDWTTYFEVVPTNDEVLIAKPVGKEQGMGILGFCYVPYHFVYNLRHPVLIQVSKDSETFQFPMTVLIEGNLPRKSVGTQAQGAPQDQVCENKNSNVELNIYDEDISPINEASVDFECVGVSCSIDYSINEGIPTKLPQCANGVLRIDADGYKPYKSIYSSVSDGSVAVVLEKEYEKEVSILAAGKTYEDRAIVTFTSDEFSKTLIYPENNKISLFAGNYEVQIYLYKNSELKLEATTTQECYTIPRSGLLGLAGLTKKECSTVNVDEQIITDALIGGGNGEYSFSKAELRDSNSIELSLDTIIIPETLDELQQNYLLFDVSRVEVKTK